MAGFLDLMQERVRSASPLLDSGIQHLCDWGRGARHRPRSGTLRVGVAFAAGTMLGLAVMPAIWLARMPTTHRISEDDAIDRDSIDSFPASDPPQRWR